MPTLTLFQLARMFDIEAAHAREEEAARLSEIAVELYDRASAQLARDGLHDEDRD